AISSSAGLSVSNGRMTPRAAPPAPSSRMRLPAKDTRAFCSMSVTRPTPSVLSPRMVAPSIFSVLTAPAACALGQRSGIVIGIHLERHRDIGALATTGNKGLHGGRKTVQRRQQLLIHQMLIRLPREAGVDVRGLAVLDGITHHHISIRHRH